MSGTRPIGEPNGPFRVDHVREGDRYELSQGHPIYCAPGGGNHARGAVTGALVLATDPAVEEAGMDAGYRMGDRNLHAPDVAVGNVPDRPGWIEGVPPLAVEYAARGQDEGDLAEKIEYFLANGTQAVWVVRLEGHRRVEVFEPGREMRVAGPGDLLTAPGILARPVPAEALFDAEAARDAALHNMLSRYGYRDLSEVRQEGREEGRLAGMRADLLAVLETRGLALATEDIARIEACADSEDLRRWLLRAVVATAAEGLLD